jgi:oxygen-independent coproporphyrinogen III oxidase
VFLASFALSIIMMPPADLLHKYNLPTPRYTSYPTVPYWQEGIDLDSWKNVFREQFTRTNASSGISLYLHLPFCESLCTYCGCNKKITTNHAVETEYLRSLVQEWNMYRQLMAGPAVIREIHLGGGTPTFFSAENLSILVRSILEGSVVHPDHNFSLEGHPNNTTPEHLETLFRLGFRRVSYGVQDMDPEVQRLIHRIQPFENVRRATVQAREIGYQSVNFDLIYGLPRQTVASIETTIEQCITLKPDRVAFYSYAHVPWTSRGQRLFDESHLPGATQKMELYQRGKELFLQHHYQDIGMDHFALRGDKLFTAWETGRLHRNFMGYTTQHTSMVLGLGVSAISDSTSAFVQNSKTLHDYYARVSEGLLPVEKGYFLHGEDQAFRRYILDISCRGRTELRTEDMDLLEQFSFPELQSLAADGLLEYDRRAVHLTPLGRNFIRNCCRAFDLHLLREKSSSQKPSFSRAI